MRRVRSLCCAMLLLAALHPAHAQDRGAVRLHALVNGLTVTPRVLIIGARPADADADLIAWLALGAHVQTGILSLTRGESAPNYTGIESGATLGAIHVQELLAARRIDGGEQYFTRAYDVGPARNAAELFEQWDHTELLGDVVTIVRAFRPHVIIARFRPDTLDGDGQQQASAVIAREAFDASLDTVRFATKTFGLPWSPTSLYAPGAGVTMDSRSYDRVRGRTYADIAVESRSQLRSFGFETPPWRTPTTTHWHRISTRAADSTDGSSSIFSGIDTSFIRLQRDVPRELVHGVLRPFVSQIPAILTFADSARHALDLEHPARILPYLRRVAELTASARPGLRACRHPAQDALASFTEVQCRSGWLDLDASLDLVQRRAADALLAAAGVTVEAVSDREFLASGDTALVAITVFNNGDSTVLVNDVAVTGAEPVRMTDPVLVPAHGSARLDRQMTSAPYAHPWWIWKREKNFFPRTRTALDGAPRAMIIANFDIEGIAIPENIRRLSDVRTTITIGTTTLTSSVGQVVFKTADPVLGTQDRALSGVPAVTLGFERALEWAQAGKAMRRHVRVTVKNYSDTPRRLSLRPTSSAGAVKIDSVPSAFTLAPHDAHEVSIQLRGTPQVMRYDLALLASSAADTFDTGVRSAQYSYLSPLHFFRRAVVSVQAVEVEIPSRLAVAYVRGAGDDADVALKQLGIPAYALNNEGLTRMDLEGMSTVVIGPDAFRVDRGLLTQVPRLTEFARKGGTVVILSNPQAVAQPGVLPFPIGFAQPFAERVTRAHAPVAVVDARSRVLTWPNVIRDVDWSAWVGARALSVPTVVDPRYALAVETHDPEQRENRNSILVATVGKGRIVYTSLTLTQQIANAVPGAMRVFVNLLSAGLPVEARVAGRAGR